MVFLLSWRSSAAAQGKMWTPEQALVLHDASCLRVLQTLARRFVSTDSPAYYTDLAWELQGLFQQPTPPRLPALTSACSHLLFFDGGSRGNPGPGGAGAVIVRIDPLNGDAEILWSAAMSHASRSTTNNQAEYQGLLVGLGAATSLKLKRVEVVGDSALIIRQLLDYRPPRNKIMCKLYTRARRLADQLCIRRWTHHVRAHNKIADLLANLAMDSRSSSQVLHPTTRDGHSDLSVTLYNDLLPWLAASTASSVER